jgi:hypothetical protein
MSSAQRRSVTLPRSAWIAAAVTGVLACAGVVASAAPAAGSRHPTRLQCVQSVLGLDTSAPTGAGATPPSVVADYAIMRRPQAASDRPAGSADVAQALAPVMASYDPTTMRLLDSTSTGTIYLVAGILSRFVVAPGCATVIPATQIALARAVHLEHGSGPGYAIIEVPSTSQVTADPGIPASTVVGCSSFALQSDGFQLGQVILPSGEYALALAPDGVGEVEVHNVAPEKTFVLPVQHNLGYAAVQYGTANIKDLRTAAQIKRFANDALPVSVTWLTAAGGTTVQAFTRPAALLNLEIATITALSQMHP